MQKYKRFCPEEESPKPKPPTENIQGNPGENPCLVEEDKSGSSIKINPENTDSKIEFEVLDKDEEKTSAVVKKPVGKSPKVIG